MGILDFLKNKIVKKEESEEDKVRKNIQSCFSLLWRHR